MKTLVLLVSVLALSQVAVAADTANARNYRCTYTDPTGASLVLTGSVTGTGKSVQMKAIFWDQKTQATLVYAMDGAQVPAAIFPSGVQAADYDILMGPGTAIDGSPIEKMALIVSKTIVDDTSSSGEILVTMGEEGKMTSFTCSEGN